MEVVVLKLLFTIIGGSDDCSSTNNSNHNDSGNNYGYYDCSRDQLGLEQRFGSFFDDRNTVPVITSRI